MSWKKEIEEIKLRKSIALRLGGKDKVKKQHNAGRLTVRERISYLLDKDSFNEVGILAGQSSYDSIGNLKDITPANLPFFTISLFRTSCAAFPVTE